MIVQLGKYRIDAVLGKGAMGIVYKAFDPGIERAVALKTIHKEMFGEASRSELISRFKNEAQAAGRLNHPNIVTVYDYGEDAEAAYIAMEFVEGSSLDRLLAPGVPTGLPQVLGWMGGLLGALDYAHSRGVVHRDVKPANLLVTPAAQVKISDFGVAHIESSSLTRAGSMIGTPSYMSPEQFRGDAVDGRSDLFSAGIVLYQLLTGERPFSGTAAAVMQQILNEDPKPPSAVLGRLGRGFDEVVARSLARQAAQRYPSARVFHEALLDAAGAGPDAIASGDTERTLLAPGWPGAAGQAMATGGAQAAAAEDVGMHTLTPWKQAAFPEVEACLAHQIGPVARILLRKVAHKAGDLEQLAEFLAPHIPSEAGRTQFRQALAGIRIRLDAAGTGRAIRGMGGPDRKGQDLAQAGIDAVTRQLVAIIGPIGRVLARRAAEQASDWPSFLGLLASHIDNPGERARFLTDAGAAP